MEENPYMLTAKQYNELYCKAFARLAEISRMAERAMQDLEELQLSMADQLPPPTVSLEEVLAAEREKK